MTSYMLSNYYWKPLQDPFHELNIWRSKEDVYTLTKGWIFERQLPVAVRINYKDKQKESIDLNVSGLVWSYSPEAHTTSRSDRLGLIAPEKCLILKKGITPEIILSADWPKEQYKNAALFHNLLERLMQDSFTR